MNGSSRGTRSPWRRLFRLGGVARIARDVDDEMQFHLESRTDDLRRMGMPEQEARARAEQEYGDLAASRRELSDVDHRHMARRSRAAWWSGWKQDLTFALRGMRRRPGFSFVVVATLALGIGATSAVFTLVNAVLLRPLPYRDTDRLVHLWDTRLDNASERGTVSYPNFLDWRVQSRSFASLDGYNQTNLTFTTGNDASRIRGARVTPGFLETLGVRPMAGRGFAEADAQHGNVALAIISHGFWQNQLGGRADVVGQSIMLDGAAHTIIGVLPSDFHFAPVQDAAVWLPLESSARRNDMRGFHWLSVVGRLRRGVAPATARAELATIMQRLAAQYPENNAGRSATFTPLRDVVVGEVRPLLVLLFSAVGLVLLIACVNVAGLLLARSSTRAQELAVRAALGASRARMARTLFAESLVLSLLGGVLGVVFAAIGARFLTSAMPEGMRLDMPTLSEVRVNGAMLALTALVTMACGIGTGLMPALHAGRHDLSQLMRRGGRNVAGGDGLARNLFIVAEIAITVVLLVGTGLLGRSLVKLLHSDFGFDTGNVLTARISLAGDAYGTAARQQQFFEALLARVRALPDVRFAGAISNPPFNGGGSNEFRVEGEKEPSPGERPVALIRGVAGAYFETLGIRVMAGRAFAPTDDSAQPRVIVANASLAKRLFPNGQAIGRRVQFFGFENNPWTVVGVVADVKTGALDAPPPPTIYMSHLQSAENRMSLVLRSGGDPTSLIAAVRHEVRALDANLPLYAVETMTQRMNRLPEVYSRRFPLDLITAFSVSALLLATVGIYGVIAQAVSSRTREFGVRLALGARRMDIIALVLRQGTRLALAGVVAGTLAAMWLTRWLQSLLFNVERLDATTYAAVALLVFIVAAAACLMPARRAMVVDPVSALRAGE